MRRDEILKLIEEVARTGQTKLDLSGKQVSELSAEITQLTNLTEFDLRWNDISQLPAEIGELTNLINYTMFDERRVESGLEANSISI